MKKTIKSKNIFSRAGIAGLCAEATHPDEMVSRPAVGKLFSDVVEVLCDSFLPRNMIRYDKIFSQIIDYCRHLPEGKKLDYLLGRFGLKDETALLLRKKKIDRVRRFPAPSRGRIRKICVLSRVTVGADVAVTGVVLSKLRRVFPGVKVVVVGPKKLSEIFGGYPGIRIREVPYVRRGGLLGRLLSWTELVGVIERERRGLKKDEFLVIDPDSRLTQLGLLPVVPEDRGYYFFPSRIYNKARTGRIGELAANWMDDVFGAGTDTTYPEVFIDRQILALSRNCVGRLSGSAQRPVVCINFGVGGNEKKRVSSDFEQKLVSMILKKGFAVILDKGFGDEVQGMNASVEKLKTRGAKVCAAQEKNIQGLAKGAAWKADVLTWEGGLAVFGALIASSDVYIGYDSGFQHIASAQGVPVIDVLVGAPSRTFVRRWTPYGKNSVRVVGGGRLGKHELAPEHVLFMLEKLLRERKQTVSGLRLKSGGGDK